MASEAKNSNKVEIFSYIARDKKSSVVKGEIKAIQERMVVDQLKKMNLDPISISVKKVSIYLGLIFNFLLDTKENTFVVSRNNVNILFNFMA